MVFHQSYVSITHSIRWNFRKLDSSKGHLKRSIGPKESPCTSVYFIWLTRMNGRYRDKHRDKKFPSQEPSHISRYFCIFTTEKPQNIKTFPYQRGCDKIRDTVSIFYIFRSSCGPLRCFKLNAENRNIVSEIPFYSKAQALIIMSYHCLWVFFAGTNFREN